MDSDSGKRDYNHTVNLCGFPSFLGILAALIFQPVRKGTLSIIEKIYLGKRFTAFEDLRSFSDSLNSIVDLNVLV